jgi:hypothetical protein|tara:strand:+ start:672 stop:965 length:294 start_codon:yes stop_codon:yes gene_type:complete
MTKKAIITPNGQEIVDKTEEEILQHQQEIEANALPDALEHLRKIRNSLLAETDWMANSDLTMSDEWKTYRQQLRDITNGLTTVDEVQAVEFPTKPSE